MRIFSNFDTNLKKRTFQRYQEEFWKDNVTLITKGWLFWCFNVFFPVFLYVIFAWLLWFLLYSLVARNIFFNILIPIFVWWLFLTILTTLNKYIAYKMDFVVVTPHFLIRYDQNWFFSRWITTINTLNIKTITVAKEWLLYSVFNTGDLVFLSEWTDIVHWEIIVHCIHKPERVRHAIYHIMKKNI